MSLLSKFHPNLEISRRNSIKFSSHSNIEGSLNFSIKIHFISKEVPMEKIVPLFKTFKIIFYLNFSEQGKVLFWSVKIWKDLNSFEPFKF
jgi:hypothetical protein